jgi:hypothetical protein
VSIGNHSAVLENGMVVGTLKQRDRTGRVGAAVWIGGQVPGVADVLVGPGGNTDWRQPD